MGRNKVWIMKMFGFLKKSIKNIIFRSALFGRISVSLCVRRNKLPDIICAMNSPSLREMFFLPQGRGRSQLNQDLFALLASRFQKGYFVEIGANDGFDLSNTQYLESEWGWDGLLVEANPKYKESLMRRRAAKEMVAVMDERGDYIFVDAGLYGGVVDQLDDVHADRTAGAQKIRVPGKTLVEIFVDNDVPPIVNFISIDVEGAELSIVRQLCSQGDYRFVCGVVEHNYRKSDYVEISALLGAAGYTVVWEGSTQHDLFFVDLKLIEPALVLRDE